MVINATSLASYELSRNPSEEVFSAANFHPCQHFASGSHFVPAAQPEFPER